jgi:hypothetical protein
MCIHCTGFEEERDILRSEDGTWYLAVPTSPWSSEYVYDIEYCPYCGRELPKKTKYIIHTELIEEYEVEAINEEEAKKLYSECKAKLISRKDSSKLLEKGD